MRWYTPLNEPIVNALMCGRRGLWPPYLRGDRGYLRVMMALANGIARTVDAIRAVQPDAVMVHVEAAGLSRTSQESLNSLALEDELQNFLCYDLITGRVTHEHPLFVWLVRNGVSTRLLDRLATNPLTLDVMGLNFYPQWSTRQIYFDQQGRLAYRVIEKGGEGFSDLIERYYNRYRTPIIITETSARGANKIRERWLETSVAHVKAMRGKGIPVVGYTWFPLFTMIDWRYRYGREPAEEYRLELGLFKLNPDASGPRWLRTPLVPRFRAYTERPEEAIGQLVVSG